MNEASKISRQPTLLDLDSDTSSPASADGPTPSDSPALLTTPTSGPARAHANRSRPRARGAERATLDIFGRHGSHSSASVDLQRSLESRLRAATDLNGSMLYSLTWNDAVTPSGRRICALRASVRRTSGKDSGGLPTPRHSMGHHMICWSRAHRGDHRSQLEDFLAWMWLADGGPRLRSANAYGLTRTPEHKSWEGMRQRCQNPTNAAWSSYGGRGITVCESWESFENFLADMGPKPSHAHSIDRVDNDRGYEPGNCRWATRTEQNRNKRNVFMNDTAIALARYLKRRGERVTDIAHAFGCNRDAITRCTEGIRSRWPNGRRAGLEAKGEK